MEVDPNSQGKSPMVVLRGKEEIEKYLATMDPQTKRHFAIFPAGAINHPGQPAPPSAQVNAAQQQFLINNAPSNAAQQQLVQNTVSANTGHANAQVHGLNASQTSVQIPMQNQNVAPGVGLSGPTESDEEEETTGAEKQANGSISDEEQKEQ